MGDSGPEQLPGAVGNLLTSVATPLGARWESAPAAVAPVVLAGDTNGPGGANETNSFTPAIGDANIPFGTVPVDPLLVMPLVRQSTAAGGAVDAISLAQLAAAMGASGFNFVLSSRADVLALPGVGAGPRYTMPAGTYALVDDIALDPNEGLDFGDLSQIFGGGYAIIGDSDIASGPVVQFDTAQSAAYGLGVSNTQGVDAIAVEITSGALLSSVDCRFTSSGGANGSAALSVVDGDWTDHGSRLLGVSEGLLLAAAGEANCFGTRIEATAAGGDGIRTFGALDCTGCEVIALGEGIEQLAGTVRYAGGSVTASGDAIVAVTSQSVSLELRGVALEHLVGGAAVGVAAENTLTGRLDVVGCTFGGAGGASAVVKAGALETIASARIVECTATDDWVIGIDWAAGEVPAGGLVEHSNVFLGATPFNGHDEADAGVNRRACFGPAGALLETAIVV